MDRWGWKNKIKWRGRVKRGTREGIQGTQLKLRAIWGVSWKPNTVIKAS